MHRKKKETTEFQTNNEVEVVKKTTCLEFVWWLVLFVGGIIESKTAIACETKGDYLLTHGAMHGSLGTTNPSNSNTLNMHYSIWPFGESNRKSLESDRSSNRPNYLKTLHRTYFTISLFPFSYSITSRADAIFTRVYTWITPSTITLIWKPS